ncbi:MAG: hypothetical protein RL217_1924 [Pseudomonadota bacterium]|jgi:electron transport complex protein RnfG
MQTLLSSIFRNAIALGLFALVTAGVVIITQQATGEKIDHNVRLAKAKALNEIVPAGSYDNDILASTLSLAPFNTELLGPIKAQDQALVVGRNNEVDTVLLPVVAPDGYTQEIRLLVGIHKDGRIAGVRITEHRETPGLGDKVDIKKSNWVQGFVGKSLADPTPEKWKVQKDGGEFDQFTGATITPRAVVLAVSRALVFFEQNRAQLLDARALKEAR